MRCQHRVQPPLSFLNLMRYLQRGCNHFAGKMVKQVRSTSLRSNPFRCLRGRESLQIENLQIRAKAKVLMLLNPARFLSISTSPSDAIISGSREKREFEQILREGTRTCNCRFYLIFEGRSNCNRYTGRQIVEVLRDGGNGRVFSTFISARPILQR